MRRARMNGAGEHRLGRRFGDVPDAVQEMLRAFLPSRMSRELQQLEAMGIKKFSGHGHEPGR